MSSDQNRWLVDRGRVVFAGGDPSPLSDDPADVGAALVDALATCLAEIERLRAAAADESVPYFRSDYEARVKAGTNGPDLWPYPRSCT